MDDLDRLYRRLVHNVRTSRPEYLSVPFTVQELYEQLVPYRHNRRELAIETNQDYEVAIARLLSGERGYISGDEAMQSAVRAELESSTAEPGAFRDFATAHIALVGAAGSDDGSVAAAAPESPVRTTTDVSERASAAQVTPVHATDPAATHVVAPHSAPVAAAPGIPSLSDVTVPVGCRFCGGTLPDDRDVNYCPHCGQNLKTRHCPACGTELDASWRFCVTCGRAA